MSHSEASDQIRPGSAEPSLQDTTPLPSSRTLNSSSRLSFYTEPTTRRSSFQSARASLYQDAESSLAYDDANDDFINPDLDSDLEVPSQRPSRSRTASPFDYPRPGSAASFTHTSIAAGASNIAARIHSRSIDYDDLETTLDVPAASTLGRRRSSKRQSVEMSRPLSSLSRRSSNSGTGHEDPQHRLRDAATAAANRSSMSARRHSVEIDQLANSISRASTPHGFRTEDDDEDAASRPRSRPASSLALRRYEQDGGSFIKRDGRDKGSILPPAGFFAPKKPSARNSSSNLLATAASPTPAQAGRSTTPLSFYSTGLPAAASAIDAEKTEDQAREEILDYRSISPAGYERQSGVPARAPSPWGIAGSAHSHTSSSQHVVAYGADQQAINSVPAFSPHEASDGFPSPSAQPSPHSVVRMMTSTDPLLPARAIPNAAANGAAGAGLGFNTSAAGPSESRAESSAIEQRATLPKSRSTPQTAIQAANVDSTAENKGTTIPSAKFKRGSRNYRNHKGDNRFFLGGLLMTSGDNPLPFILSYLLLLALGGLFFGFEAKWLSDNISPAVIAVFAYIWLQAVVNMGVTAFRDPGIIPRNLDPDPPCVLGDTPFEPGRHAVADPEDPLAIPVQRVLRIRNQTVKVKWCETCGTYRPPRSSHCRVCDNCVENIDHHCTYLNNCIGRRNYVQFMVFLLSSILSALYVIAFTALRLVLLTKPRSYRYPRSRGSVTAPGYDFRQALSNSPVSAVLFLLCIGAVAPLLVLFTYHVRLILLNRSTVEQIRINTARDYGEHKELELGTHGDDDAASTYGAAETNRRSRRGGAGVVRALFERFGVLKPKYKDPNPFATRSTRTNVRNAVGWRSVQLESWIDRRGVVKEDVRQRHPRAG
ncbi:related to ERF2 - subunit of a palmitoyltransferase [Ustilago trichophora]|uniref:Palmitoyltransferase n=1 Tax=Ustilago trichophora TaxID=86804 RepID=A0A5C3ELG5_9BASI|nr:related to ERF2 - subunit of a palmitoyltransferase [Ustilago trichophora]